MSNSNDTIEEKLIKLEMEKNAECDKETQDRGDEDHEEDDSTDDEYDSDKNYDTSITEDIIDQLNTNIQDKMGYGDDLPGFCKSNCIVKIKGIKYKFKMILTIKQVD